MKAFASSYAHAEKVITPCPATGASIDTPFGRGVNADLFHETDVRSSYAPASTSVGTLLQIRCCVSSRARPEGHDHKWRTPLRSAFDALHVLTLGRPITGPIDV